MTHERRDAAHHLDPRAYRRDLGPLGVAKGRMESRRAYRRDP